MQKQSIENLRRYADTVSLPQFVKFVVERLTEGPYKADKATVIISAVYKGEERENIRAIVSEFYLTPKG